MEGVGFTEKIIQFINVIAGLTETQQQEDFLYFFPQNKSIQPAEIL